MKPKYLKKTKASGLKWVLTVVALLVLIAAAVIIGKDVWQEKASQRSDSQSTENATAESSETTDETVSDTTTPDKATPSETAPDVTVPEKTEVTEESLELLEFANGEIQTPYLTLYYPESFEDYLLIANNSHDPYILEFYAVLPEKTEQRIFDVCLGAGSDGNLGVVLTDTEEIPVSMTVYSFVPDSTWNEREIDTVLAMQEAANELIRGLEISAEGGSPVLKEAPEETTIVNFTQIDTPYCVLKYPAIWADLLYTEQRQYEDVYKVEFYCSLDGHEQLLMFTVLFGGDEGEQLGVVTNADDITVPVNILMNVPSEDGLQDEELNTLYAMQEAVNQLIQQLPLQ